MWNQYTAQATKSVNGSSLSNWEMAHGMDRHDLSSDGKLMSAALERRVITNFKSTTLGKILSSDKFIKFDMLARNVIEEGFDMKTPCEVGSAGKYQELVIGDMRFVQVGTSYYGDVNA